MSLFTKTLFCVVSLAGLACGVYLPAAAAQERAVVESLETETKWSGIANSLNKTQMAAQTVAIRLSQSSKCAAKGRMYAPGINGADAEGCLAAPYSSAILNKFIACGDQGLIYAMNQDRCLSTIEKVQVCSMRTTTITSNMSYGNRCPAGYNNMGTVFAGYKSSGWHDGCETCNPIYTTTCATMVCEYK